MNNNEKNDSNCSASKIKKIKKKIKPKNSEEKNNSQIKNSIFSKVIIKSNSIINNNNNEHYLLNYKNKMALKNPSFIPKNNNQGKNKNKAKIKTTFSNYYTDFLFKNNNKQNCNFTEINYGGEDTDEISHIRLNNEANEDSLKLNKLKYVGLYNTDSSQKINFNQNINISNNNSSKENSKYKKGSVIISPHQKKNNNKEKKNVLEISNKKINKLRLGQNSETKKNINSNNSIKDLKNLDNSYNKNKILIKSQNTNNYIKIKKEKINKKNYLKNKDKNVGKNKEKNKNKNIDKQNKTKILENNNINHSNNKNNNKINHSNNNNNKTSKKNINDKKKSNERHIFLSPVQKNISSIIVKIKSSTKKMNKVNYTNYFSQYNTTNSTSNKENKKIIFQRKENNKIINNSNNSNNNSKIEKDNNSRIEKDKKKQNVNNNIIINNSPKEKIPKLDISTHINMLSFKDDLEVNNIETDIYKLMNEHKELSPTIVSEDKTIEKDLYLENNNNNDIKSDKNLVDYFKTARKALKSMSHSLVDPINNKNNIFNDNDLKNKLNEGRQISNRNKEDDIHNYTIKKVPIFVGVNMFPSKKIEYNFLNNIFSKQSKDNKIKKYIIEFLDDKSIMNFSCINKILYKNIRKQFYTKIYNKIYENKDFIKKINHSLFKIVSIQLKKNKNQLEILYDSYTTQTSYNEIILNDLYRTFPNDSKFQKNSINYNKLYNILTKYSNYNPIIGYAQGLNFLFANALYLYENEKNAFFYIDGLIKRFKLENYLAEKNSKLTNEIKKFSKILSKYIPDITNYFDKKLVNHEFFSTGWILTLFSNSMNYYNLFICWDFMIIFGWKFFYCFVIQILVYYKSLIFETNENSLSYLMKNLLKEKKFTQDLPKIINNTLDFMQKHIIL